MALTAKALTRETADAITMVSGLFAWGNAPGQASGYVLVEASLTAGHRHVEQALARAADLERGTGVPTRAVVVSDRWQAMPLKRAARASGIGAGPTSAIGAPRSLRPSLRYPTDGHSPAGELPMGGVGDRQELGDWTAFRFKARRSGLCQGMSGDEFVAEVEAAVVAVRKHQPAIPLMLLEELRARTRAGASRHGLSYQTLIKVVSQKGLDRVARSDPRS